ncbi:MAG: hypothetical protein EXX96DRAFT_551032 [Benjaminiella poitrasii]|nr:MAG: hypothetical protein EXX96DRAFT_551032 [Benjaminiella poitrasii]
MSVMKTEESAMVDVEDQSESAPLTAADTDAAYDIADYDPADYDIGDYDLGDPETTATGEYGISDHNTVGDHNTSEATSTVSVANGHAAIDDHNETNGLNETRDQLDIIDGWKDEYALNDSDDDNNNNHRYTETTYYQTTIEKESDNDDHNYHDRDNRDNRDDHYGHDNHGAHDDHDIHDDHKDEQQRNQKKPRLNQIEKFRHDPNYPVPSKTFSLNHIRTLGKFVSSWRFHQPEICCICYQGASTNKMVYCDNPLCEVCVHIRCFRPTPSPYAMHSKWTCDKCSYLAHIEEKRQIVANCALCPNVQGLFCRLNAYVHDIPWVHYTCASMLAKDYDNFMYQSELGEYEVRFDTIPKEAFEKVCTLCEDELYAKYGAKVSCNICSKSFHVTCAEQANFFLDYKKKVVTCLDHEPKSTEEVRENWSTTIYYRWISERDTFLYSHFSKSLEMYAIDGWKRIIRETTPSFSMGCIEINKYYEAFFEALKGRTYTIEGTYYSRWVDYILTFFSTYYSAFDTDFRPQMFKMKEFNRDIPYNFQKIMSCEAPEYKRVRKEMTRMMPAKNHTKTTVPSEHRLRLQRQRAEKMAKMIQVRNEKTRATRLEREKRELQVVQPSKDLVCTICHHNELPEEVWKMLELPENYLEHLEATKDERKPGHTGSGSKWDPRVFIQCSVCESKVHCGCPFPPIKAYPRKFEKFICIQCDVRKEDKEQVEVDSLATTNTSHSRRTHVVNYKE